MKKIFTTLLAASLMLLGTQAFAQMSVNAGYLNSTQSFSESNSKSINSNGAYAGVSFNLPISGGLAVAPGVYYYPGHPRFRHLHLHGARDQRPRVPELRHRARS